MSKIDLGIGCRTSIAQNARLSSPARSTAAGPGVAGSARGTPDGHSRFLLMTMYACDHSNDSGRPSLADRMTKDGLRPIAWSAAIALCAAFWSAVGYGVAIWV
ncbi:MAG TPA: hypothetical protein VGB91_13670 [Rhizomicrobium sp.]